jgi:hypothetical protein
MRGLIAGLRAPEPTLDFVVTGSTFDDDELLRAGNTFVTGPVDAADLASVFRHYQLDRLILCLTRPLFGHPVLSMVLTSDLPVAYFDWSQGCCPARDADLPLEPSLPVAGVAERVKPWLQGQQLP